jgi:hypothetical protein
MTGRPEVRHVFDDSTVVSTLGMHANDDICKFVAEKVGSEARLKRH